MKAIVQAKYGTSEVLDLRDIAKPEIGEGDVLVRVRAAGLDRRSGRACPNVTELSAARQCA